MRATRFRQSAGLISWSLKDGSAPKNQRILDLIPAEFKDPSVNSIKGWRDLDAAEIKTIQAGHKKTPQKARKKNRAAKAEKELANAETITDSVEEEVDPDGLTSSHEENGIYTQDDDEESPLGTYQVHRMSSIHDGQQENSPAVPVQFAPNEDTNSMQTRYHDPPIHCKQEKLTQPKTTEKRKRTGNNTTKHVEGQRSTKRTLMPTPILALPPPALILPSQHEQLETQNTGFPPTRTDETESFLNELYRYADEEICEEEDTQIEDPGQMQRVDEQYEDSEHMNSPLYWPLVEQPEQMLRVTHQYADPERVRAPHYWP